MRSLFPLAFSSLLTCAALAGPALAAPGLVPVQGVLTTVDGTPLDGDTDLYFAIYDAVDASSPLWSETQTVDLDAGFFTAYLGVNAALEMTLFADAVSPPA